MTREEAINYAEAIKAKTQEKIEFYRRGNARAPEVYYSDLAFLSAAISALREQEERRWIPVTERLPDVGIEVLIYSEDDGVCVDYYGGDSFGYYNVTHWMPLPEPPKEE